MNVNESLPEVIGLAVGSVRAYNHGQACAELTVNSPVAVGERLHILGRRPDVEVVVEVLEVRRRRLRFLAIARLIDDYSARVPGEVLEGDAVFRLHRMPEVLAPSLSVGEPQRVSMS